MARYLPYGGSSYGVPRAGDPDNGPVDEFDNPTDARREFRFRVEHGRTSEGLSTPLWSTDRSGGVVVTSDDDSETIGFITHREIMGNPAIDEIRARMDRGDRWGSVMGERFGIASVLYVIGEEVPTEWEFWPGMGLTVESVREEFPDSEWLDAIESGSINVDDITRAGDILARYASLLERAGESYSY